MTTSLSNITVKDGQNTLVVKANDITINGSSILATNNFVTLDTDQSITGAKIFLVDTSRRATNIERGVAPSTNQYASYMIRDKNNTQIANFYVTQDVNNSMLANMIATNLNSSNTAFDARISVAAKRDGTVYTSAPTPATSDNSTQIATTAWVKNQGYVTLNTDQTITGTKTFSGTTIVRNFNLSKENSDKEGGQIVFLGADNEVNAGKTMYIDRYDGRFRFIGQDSSSNVKVSFEVDIQNNKVTCYTPAASDNSTRVATTAYVNNKHQVVSALPASPDTNVFYYIPA